MRYVKRHDSYGASTLKNKHVNFTKGKCGEQAKIEFVGKKGVINKDTITNSHMVKLLKTLAQKNKKFLFQYQGQDNNNHLVSSEHITNKLHEYDPDLTPKMFRTWAANTNFIKEANNRIMDKKSLSQPIKKVAHKLNHTPAVC